MRILLLSRYSRLGASSRLRFYQYLPHLDSTNIRVTVAPLMSNDYVTGLYGGKVPVAKVARAYITRLLWMRRARRFNVIWMEKELLPWIPAWIELALLPTDVPVVVDYDDAVFHRYDRHPSALVRRILGRKIDALMRRASLVVVGNDYLAERAKAAGARHVEFLPTVVDAERYTVESATPGRTLTLGWIGSPATASYLSLVASSLREMIASRRVRVVAVGANPQQVEHLPVEARPWREETEVSEIQQFDIGIMPLPDEPFERGKCGYKSIQYMACGKPVVASPVGINSVIVRQGVDGFLASTTTEWTEALRKLVDDAALRQRMGAAGRERVLARYSLAVAAPKLEQLLRSVVGKRSVV